MKKQLFLLSILAGIALLSACVGTKALGVFDESVPEDLLCPLEIRNNLAVILFNNQPVEWAPGFSENKVTISLPPGEHSFSVRYYYTRSYGNYTESVAATSEVAMEFLPGHSYRIYEQKVWLLLVTVTNIKIKDVTK